jgi:hypothetical protein
MVARGRFRWLIAFGEMGPTRLLVVLTALTGFVALTDAEFSQEAIDHSDYLI